MKTKAIILVGVQGGQGRSGPKRNSQDMTWEGVHIEGWRDCHRGT